MAFLFYRGKILLILRDNKPDISFPNTWSPPTGGLEEGETFPICVIREIFEELGIKVMLLTILGVSAKGNAYYIGLLTDEEVRDIVLGEGQRYQFFSWDELVDLTIGGAFKIYMERFPVEMRLMFSMTELPGHEFGKQLGLAIWNGDTDDVEA